MKSWKIIDQATWPPPRALRFLDHLTKRPISEGLRVTVQPFHQETRRPLGRAILSQPTSQGLFLLPRASQATSKAFVLEVQDSLGRYLPMQLDLADAFSEGSKWYQGQIPGYWHLKGGQDSTLQTIFLWSAPTRKLPTHWGVIRADIRLYDGDGLNDESLKDKDTVDKLPPAKFAIVEVTQDDGSDSAWQYFGITDARGGLFLPIPYPPIKESTSDSDLNEYIPLARQTFPIHITVRWQKKDADLGNDGEQTQDQHGANLKAVFEQQLAQIIDFVEDSPSSDLNNFIHRELTFDRPLVLKTRTSQNNDLSCLYIQNMSDNP